MRLFPQRVRRQHAFGKLQGALEIACSFQQSDELSDGLLKSLLEMLLFAYCEQNGIEAELEPVPAPINKKKARAT